MNVVRWGRWRRACGRVYILMQPGGRWPVSDRVSGQHGSVDLRRGGGALRVETLGAVRSMTSSGFDGCQLMVKPGESQSIARACQLSVTLPFQPLQGETVSTSLALEQSMRTSPSRRQPETARRSAARCLLTSARCAASSEAGTPGSLSYNNPNE